MMTSTAPHSCRRVLLVSTSYQLRGCTAELRTRHRLGFAATLVRTLVITSWATLSLALRCYLG